MKNGPAPQHLVTCAHYFCLLDMTSLYFFYRSVLFTSGWKATLGHKISNATNDENEDNNVHWYSVYTSLFSSPKALLGACSVFNGNKYKMFGLETHFWGWDIAKVAQEQNCSHERLVNRERSPKSNSLDKLWPKVHLGLASFSRVTLS